MEETKNGSDPAPDQESQTFKQHYAGTFIAKRYEKYNHPIHQAEQPNDSEGEPIPMEFKTILEWVRKPENHTYVTTGCAALAVAITAIYTLFAVLQWLTLMDSNQINREALWSVQRAIVSFQNFSQTRISDPDAPATKHLDRKSVV